MSVVLDNHLGTLATVIIAMIIHRRVHEVVLRTAVTTFDILDLSACHKHVHGVRMEKGKHGKKRENNRHTSCMLYKF